MEAIQAAIYEVLSGDRPQTVRHVFYRLCEPPYSLVPKQEKRGYETVQQQLLKLRREGRIPWHWVTDGTRWRRRRLSFDSPAEAVRHVAETYRRDLWRRTPVYVEVWCESDSIAGLLYQETDRYNVALMTSRGFSSESYLYKAAMDIQEQGRPAFLYYIGDWDPSGKLVPEVIERRLREFAPRAEIHFERLLVNPEQVEEWNLSTKPPKKKSSHSRNFRGGTVEAEAIPAHVTRRILREAIEQHLDLDEVDVLEAAEESEAMHLVHIADALADRGRLNV